MKAILSIFKFIWKNKAWTIPIIKQGYEIAKPYVVKGYKKVKKILTKKKPETPESIDK